jgi:phosphatidylinositol alpha-1,6-mannosyltransferase
VSVAETRTVHITGLFPELAGTGGVQEASRLTVAALDDIARKRGWSLDFTGLNDPLGPQTLGLDQKEVPFDGFARRKVSFIRSAMKRARAAMQIDTHIIFAGHPNLAPIAAWMQKTSSHARAIVVAHGVEVWEPLPVVRRATLRSAFRVVAPSSYTIQKLIEVQRVPTERTRKLAWPISEAFLRFADRPDELRLPPGLREGQIVLSVGRAAANERYKGTDNLIRSIARLRGNFPSLRFVNVGGGDDLPRLQRLANELGVSDRVHLLQGLSRAQVAGCYARADVFALPSTGEGFGLVFLEAMAFGKPVVAAAAAGALDIVRDEVNGLLVAPDDVTALTGALGRLLADKALRDALGARGAAMVRDTYRFESFRDELERLLDECVMDSRLRK